MDRKRRLLAGILCAGLLLLSSCASREQEETVCTVPTATVPVASAVQPIQTEATLPPVVLELTQEEQEMLLKIGMAELGAQECPQCVALVMRTVLNRVEAGGFGRSIYGVLHANAQFTPVTDGTYDTAEPNDTCREALDMVIHGWDESQGALFYEFCEGESWHSRNLELVTEHCNTRFYK